MAKIVGTRGQIIEQPELRVIHFKKSTRQAFHLLNFDWAFMTACNIPFEASQVEIVTLGNVKAKNICKHCAHRVGITVTD